MPVTVTASDARAQFPSIAKQVHDEGMEVTVFKGSKPYVKIVPINASVQSEKRHKSDPYYEAYLDAAEEYAELFERLAQ